MNDYESIRNLLARYCHFLDGGDFDAWAELFSENGVWHTAGGPRFGRRAIREAVQLYPAAFRIERRHLTLNSVIEVDRDQAHADSYVLVMRRAKGGAITERSGRYKDRLEKIDGKWLIAERYYSSTAWHPPGDDVWRSYVEDWVAPEG
jgi:uncharacterized protein (TIGR02246 family)